MVTFTCPQCGQDRTGKRKRCYPCTVKHTPESKEKIRRTLTGVPHTEERRKANSESQKRRTDNNRFDLAAFMAGKPSPQRLPVGTERIVKDGRVQVKCEDGVWRYRSRAVYAEAFGPLGSHDIIHHINHDPMDDRLENLMKVTRGEHLDLHRKVGT